MADDSVTHLLRRAGFGASSEDLAAFDNLSYNAAVDRLLNYDAIPDDVDSKIGQIGFMGTTSNGAFSPRTVINDARQRWLFRMVHSNRPLQEKMTLFWHNYFATDPAMLIWLDGNTNTKQSPQENFGRELMELFSRGVGFYTEQDVYAAARVFTGWNLRITRGAGDGDNTYSFVYNANNHETAAKTFSFPIYSVGGTTIPSRAASAGMQDGLDLIAALSTHPET